MKYRLEDYTFTDCLRMSACCILMAFARAIIPPGTIEEAEFDKFSVPFHKKIYKKFTGKG